MLPRRVFGLLRPPPTSRLDPLEAALRARVEHPSALAASRTTSICFDTGPGGRWTIRFRRGEVSLERGKIGDPTSVLMTDRATLIGILEGEIQGVEAFLDGRIVVRGNLVLPLELDDLLHPRERDIRAPRCRRIQAGGVESFYLEAGPRDAPPVVMVHGLGATSASFLPLLWDLARDHRVLAVDLPGFGESEKPVRRLHAPYFARWLTAFLDATKIPRAHLVGNSMGGRVSLEVALRSPARVNRMVLLMPSLAWRRFRAAVRVVRWLRPELGVTPIPLLHPLVIRLIHTMFADPHRVPASAMSGAADEFLRYFATPRGRIALFSAAREIYLEGPHGRRGFWTRLSTLSVPALFVFGEKDRLVPHRFQRYAQRAVPQADFAFLEDCGHVPQFELPEQTSALVRGYLDRPDAPRAAASRPPAPSREDDGHALHGGQL